MLLTSNGKAEVKIGHGKGSTRGQKYVGAVKLAGSLDAFERAAGQMLPIHEIMAIEDFGLQSLRGGEIGVAPSTFKTFYKKEVESDIRAEPSKSPQERQRMLGLLQRFEEESAAQTEELEAEDENEEDLAHRLQNVDLESTSPDQLWTLLSPAERERFLKVMEDPSSDLALQLLASEELEVEKQEPMVVASNCIAYAYATRHLSVSPLSTAPELDADAARGLLATLIPFLTSPNLQDPAPPPSTVRSPTSTRRLPPDSATPQLFALLLRDAATLLRPSLVADAADGRAGAHIRALRALGDLHALFRSPPFELEREAAVREVELTAEKVEWERTPRGRRQELKKIEIVELDTQATRARVE
ncbi:hypothetical protein B0H14DRAFT_3529056 [Mycena olivaceomarginata]|nr:hypothetical protein B0H14DRAFT_3529056 [Mycena olivaceomarginata]